MTTTLGALAEEVGVNERTLRRAVNQGTLHATRPSPRTLSLPLSERRYVRRRWRLIVQLRAVLRTEPNVRFALLFGSTARGEDSSGSDIDVLVELHDDGLTSVVALAARLTQRIGRPVDLVRLHDAEADPAFLAELVDEGRVLIDRVGRWPQLRARERSLRRRGRGASQQHAEAALAGIDRLLTA
jgi:predicted nucleotidyltransferase